ncbi:ribonuclease T2 family protein [Sphingomonas crusticola]|uniref:ribonuclease T2 family protein n=1 Tax=Sphingomonas crusticola TaxID=1697973 RepID=UPI000E22A2A4|nr:ribonuclease T [Sphingomonas crusticola]
MMGLFALAVAYAATGWALPAHIPVPHAEGASADQPRRIEPIGSYTLALIWTPEHCYHPVPGAESFQCGIEKGSGFVLHGLWPDGLGKSWPQWCADAAILPPSTIAAHFRATPSAQLMQHEWAKHGTCMGITSDAYFRRSNRLFHRLRTPDMAALGRTAVSAGTLASAFAAANPGMRPDTVNLNLDRDGWLREVWLCLDTRFRPEKCATPIAADRPVRIRLPR